MVRDNETHTQRNTGAHRLLLGTSSGVKFDFVIPLSASREDNIEDADT
jgi:hypothetical protein